MRLPMTPSLPTAPATEASARFGAPTGGSAKGSSARFEDHFNDAVEVAGAGQDAPHAAVDSADADSSNADPSNADSSNAATERAAQTADPLAQPQGGELSAAVRPQILAASMSTFWATLVPADGGESAAAGASGGEVQPLLQANSAGDDTAGAGLFDSASPKTASLTTDLLTTDAGASGGSAPAGGLGASVLAAPGTATAQGAALPASVAAVTVQGSAVSATTAPFGDAAATRAVLSPINAGTTNAGPTNSAPTALQVSIAGVTGAGVGQAGQNSSAGDGSAPEQQSPAPSVLQGNGRADGIPALAVPATTAAPVSAAVPAPAPLQAATTPLLAQLTRPLFTLATAPLGDHVMTIAVVPDSLGPVTVRAHLAADRIHIELMSASDAGREGLRTILGELRRDLAAGGMASSLSLGGGNGGPGQSGPGQGGAGQNSSGPGEPGYGGLENGAGQRGQQGPGNQTGSALPAGHRGNRDGESPSDLGNLSANNTSLDITV